MINEVNNEVNINNDVNNDVKNEINYNKLKVDSLQSQINILESQANTLNVEMNKIKMATHKLERNVYKRENPFNVRFTEYIEKHSIYQCKSGDFFEDFFDESEIYTVKEIRSVYRNFDEVLRLMKNEKDHNKRFMFKEKCLALKPIIKKIEEMYSLNLAKSLFGIHE